MLSLDQANRVIEQAFVEEDNDLISACERVIHDLSSGESTAMLGDWMMVSEALPD